MNMNPPSIVDLDPGSAVPSSKQAEAQAELPKLKKRAEHDVPSRLSYATLREALDLEDRVKRIRAYAGPPVDGLADVLDDVAAFVRRFVWLRDPKYVDIIALWVAHTWMFEASDATPYLWITSPEMRSGKTRLLDVLEVLCRRAWFIIEPSEAVTFRKIATDTPTLLLDEIDVIFARDRKSDTQAGLRALVNAGYRRGAVVPRAADFGNTLIDYPVYCAKAFAGIGKRLPATVVDRSIKIPMMRRKKDERVERFKRRDVLPEAVALQERLEAVAKDALDGLVAWREEAPPDRQLDNDRAAEVWEPLFAIAEYAGGRWRDYVRDLADMATTAEIAEVPVEQLFLQHIKEAFAQTNTTRLASHTLWQQLVQREDGPWARWWEKGDQSDLSDIARRLGEYGIKSTQIRTGESKVRGYLKRDFMDVWERYLPDEEPVVD